MMIKHLLAEIPTGITVYCIWEDQLISEIEEK